MTTPEQVRERIQSCTRCPLCSGAASRPVPFSGPPDARIAVLGEAPGELEDRRGEPFVGPSGQLLRKVLRRVGIDPAELMFFNAVSCYPAGTPTDEHLVACRGNFLAQLVLVRPDFVLVVGNTALRAVGRRDRISDVRGHPWARALRDGGQRVYSPPGTLRPSCGTNC